MEKKKATLDPEIAAIGQVDAALNELAPDAQARVLKYVADKRKVFWPARENDESRGPQPLVISSEQLHQEQQDELEGISPVAKKWLARSGLTARDLAQVFSISTDEIDLIAKKVPGNSKRARMRSVFLLKGIAAYLSTGAARFTDPQIREACLHYGAFDVANFAATLKALSAEVSGSKDTGYSLTPRGINSATDLVKEMTQGKKTD